MKKVICFMVLLATFAANAQSKISELYANSLKCHQRKNYECFLRLTEKLDSIRPSNPTYVYNLACAYALNGLHHKAFAALEKSLLMNAETDFESEPDFDSLKVRPDFQRMIVLKSDLKKEVAKSSKVVTLNEKDLHPEGLVYLEKKKLWLASSVRKGKIVSFDLKSGKCKDWLNVNGMFSVMAMKADQDQRFLWVATAANEQWIGFDKSLAGKSAVLKVDIEHREIVQTYTALGRHVFGDLVVAKNGTVYISDSYGPSLYKIDGDEITHWIDFSGPTFNFQGMTLNADESKMYVADYYNGIMAIDMNNVKNRKWMMFPERTVAKGIDGLVWYGNSLVAIHNGVKPIRIVRYFLDKGGENIVSHTIVDHNRPDFNEPTLGIVKGDKFYFFANCPWQAYDKENNLDLTKFENPMLFSFGL